MKASKKPRWRARLRANRRARRLRKSMAQTADSTRPESKELRGLVTTLQRAAAELAKSDAVKSAVVTFDAAIKDPDGRRAVAANHLTKSAALVEKLLETADDIDPHVVAEEELNRLWVLTPEELADEALTMGAYRERRLVLEAMAEQTNRRLGKIALLVGFFALLVPFIEELAPKVA